MATVSSGYSGSQGGGTSTDSGWTFDPKWAAGGLLTVVVSLLLYIWHDTTSDIEELKKSIDKLSEIVIRMDVTQSEIKKDLETLTSKQPALENLIRSSSDEIKKDINSSSMELKQLLKKNGQ